MTITKQHALSILSRLETLMNLAHNIDYGYTSEESYRKQQECNFNDEQDFFDLKSFIEALPDD